MRTRPKRRIPRIWRGIIFFVREQKKKLKEGKMLVDLLAGVYKMDEATKRKRRLEGIS